LLKLFVEPSALGSGTGKALLAWAIDVAKKLGATQLTIGADPDAAAFLPQDGSLRRRSSVIWVDTGEDFAETSDKPLPRELTFRSESGTLRPFAALHKFVSYRGYN
jgi:GNAT superfamily N-acetyltransferase